MKSITPASEDIFQASLMSWSNSLLSSLTTSVISRMMSLKGITSLQIYNTTQIRGSQEKTAHFYGFSENIFPKRYP